MDERAVVARVRASLPVSRDSWGWIFLYGDEEVAFAWREFDALISSAPGRVRMDAHERITELSVDQLRSEISRTSADLRHDLDRLYEVAHAGMAAVSNPMHLQERMERNPLLLCGCALTLGFVCARTKAYHAPVRALAGLAGGFGRLCGDVVVSACIRAAQNRRFTQLSLFS